MFHVVTRQMKPCTDSVMTLFSVPKDRCCSDCGDCCPNISVSEQCFRLAETCDCRLPTVHSCWTKSCPSPSVRILRTQSSSTLTTNQTVTTLAHHRNRFLFLSDVFQCAKWDCACTCQPPECDSCNCLCFEIRIR